MTDCHPILRSSVSSVFVVFVVVVVATCAFGGARRCALASRSVALLLVVPASMIGFRRATTGRIVPDIIVRRRDDGEDHRN